MSAGWLVNAEAAERDAKACDAKAAEATDPAVRRRFAAHARLQRARAAELRRAAE